MRAVALVLLLPLLSACGCKMDPGDSGNPSAYVQGCWTAAHEVTKRN